MSEYEGDTVTFIKDARNDGKVVIDQEDGSHVVIFETTFPTVEPVGGVVVDRKGRLDSYMDPAKCLELIKKTREETTDIAKHLQKFFG